MNLQIDQKDTFLIPKTPIVQQTAFWSEVKRKQGIGSRAFEIKALASELYAGTPGQEYITENLLLLLQKVGQKHQVAYIPYGPKTEPDEENQGPFLEELSESLRPYLPENCIMLRYDLSWESPWAKDQDRFDQKNNWMGPPEKSSQELRLNFNTQNWNLRKANTDILPSNTIFLDLRNDPETLLKNMRPKTRYNIRLSGRKGVMVKKSGLENLDIWYDLYRQTSMRNNIFLHDQEYFKTVLETKAKNTASPAEVELLIAEAEGNPLAAMFLVISGQRATYLYGASSTTNRNLMGTYALQWEAIKRARDKGCREYDMFGISPNPDPSHPLYGLYRFKLGFGGKMVHRLGCWDFPLDEAKYKTFQASEMKSPGYHRN